MDRKDMILNNQLFDDDKPSKKENKKSKKHIGFFFMGLGIGLVVMFGALAGTVAILYNTITVDGFNKLFHTSIDFGSEDLNSKPMVEIASKVLYVLDNLDTYTFRDAEADFALQIDTMLGGIDFSDIKETALAELNAVLNDKFKNLTADELAGHIGLKDETHYGPSEDGVNKAFNSKQTFYVNNGVLYLDSAKTQKVTNFEYSYNATNGEIKIGKKVYNGATGEISVTRRYLPLSAALSFYLDSISVS